MLDPDYLKLVGLVIGAGVLIFLVVRPKALHLCPRVKAIHAFREAAAAAVSTRPAGLRTTTTARSDRWRARAIGSGTVTGRARSAAAGVTQRVSDAPHKQESRTP